MLLQAVVVCVTYAFAIVLVFMPSIPYEHRRFTFQRRVLYAVAMAVYALFLSYSLTCAVSGGCVSMSWLTVLMYAVAPCTVILLYVLAFSTMEDLRRKAVRAWNS